MLVIFMGRSAVGKDTIQKELAENGIEKVVTATTRAMREGEQDGKDYHFMTNDEFDKLKEQDGFVEHTEFNGVQYGCPKSSIDPQKDQCIILEPEGVRNFINAFGRENLFIVVMELDESIRRARAEARGSFSEEAWYDRCASDDKRFDKETVNELANFHMNLNLGNTSITTAMTLTYLTDALNAYKSADREAGEHYVVGAVGVDTYTVLPIREVENSFNDYMLDDGIVPF